jgi:hypothetical protein
LTNFFNKPVKSGQSRADISWSNLRCDGPDSLQQQKQKDNFARRSIFEAPLGLLPQLDLRLVARKFKFAYISRDVHRDHCLAVARVLFIASHGWN